MNLLSTLHIPVLFLAQSLLHHHESPTPAPSPAVRITIVNAMSVPAISLNTKGMNRPVSYPYFPQGTWTADEPLSRTNVDFVARSTNGLILGEHKFSFSPVSSQIVLITGDLSMIGPAESLPQLSSSPPGLKAWEPNIQFHTYPISTETNELCRYRVVNAMPGKLLILHSAPEGNKTPQQLALLAPGNSALFVKQLPSIHWVAEIDGQSYPFELDQEGERRNCLLPFFLKNGAPFLIRVFED